MELSISNQKRLIRMFLKPCPPFAVVPGEKLH
jgi:hypothetical protein